MNDHAAVAGASARAPPVTVGVPLPIGTAVVGTVVAALIGMARVAATASVVTAVATGRGTPGRHQESSAALLARFAGALLGLVALASSTSADPSGLAGFASTPPAALSRAAGPPD